MKERVRQRRSAGRPHQDNNVRGKSS